MVEGEQKPDDGFAISAEAAAASVWPGCFGQKRAEKECVNVRDVRDFQIDENGCLTKYTGYGGNVVIPDSVTSFGNGAFYGCSSLTSITIPDSVTSIGWGAFKGCSSLTNITIPDSVTSIGWGAFKGCSSLTNITIPDSVTSIGVWAFDGCSSLKSITIPDSVTSIGDSAFHGCSSLKSITIPDGVTSIGDWAFDGCSSLKSITIPDSVTSIGDSAFSGCSSLTSITIPYSVTSIGDNAFSFCRNLMSITIPDSVTSIGAEAFEDCSRLGSLTIPDSVTSIGDSAFSGCSSLTIITIPDNLTNIAANAFKGCSITRKLHTPDSEMSQNGFLINSRGVLQKYAGPVGDVVIPDRVTSIGEKAFYGCSGLTSIVIPDTVTRIGRSAFEGCSRLTSIAIPSSMTKIGNRAFFDCSLKEVHIKSLESWLSIRFESTEELVEKDLRAGRYDPSAGEYRIYHVSNYSHPAAYSSNPLSNGAALYLNGQKVEHITIPKRFTQIRDGAFVGCSSLKSVMIPDRIASIGELAFARCKKLVMLDLPESVEEVRAFAFQRSGIKTLIIRSRTLDLFDTEYLYDVSRPDPRYFLPGTQCLEGCRGYTIYAPKGSKASKYNPECTLPLSALNEPSTPATDTISSAASKAAAKKSTPSTASKASAKKTAPGAASKKTAPEAASSLAGLTFVVTGDLVTWPERDDLKAFIEKAGGRLTGSVSKKTNYLITNDTTTGTVKLQKARELGIPIIDEDTFLKMAKLK